MSKGTFNIVSAEPPTNKQGKLRQNIVIETQAHGNVPICLTEGTLPTSGIADPVELDIWEYQGKWYGKVVGAKSAPQNVQQAPSQTRQATNSVKGDSEAQKHRSMALAYAKDLCVAGIIQLEKIQNCADEFSEYIQNGPPATNEDEPAF